MITLHLKLKVTANNQLKIDLPATVQPGEELDIAIELQDASHEKWTDAEIREVMQPEYRPCPTCRSTWNNHLFGKFAGI